ncbi:predicted protein [Histoplasma capsulatum H143]|uniref:Transmembrane protein n=1 Tax=Ajellomyces capsulatus (strain H143) TaxID=544712 RepID=C6H505_AJECH|nr:predicted protein [Histoplasma capsulatum H143]
MKILSSTHGSARILVVINLSLFTICLFNLLTLTTALPTGQQQFDSISTIGRPKGHEQRSLPGSLVTAPEGAVGEHPSPASGGEGHNTALKKTPIYFALLVISVLVCVVIVLFEKL